jgi:hypothetical protein
MVPVPLGENPANSGWWVAVASTEVQPPPYHPPYSTTWTRLLQGAQVTLVVCSVPVLVEARLTVFTSTRVNPDAAPSFRHSTTVTVPSQLPWVDEPRSSRSTAGPELVPRSPVPSRSWVTHTPVFAGYGPLQSKPTVSGGSTARRTPTAGPRAALVRAVRKVGSAQTGESCQLRPNAS